MFDIIGDIHGCIDEFVELTEKLGYRWEKGANGSSNWIWKEREGALPVHPQGRKLAFVGDLTDRGPNSVAVIEIVTALVRQKLAHYTPGNHCNKLYRYFLGSKVQISHGLETTVAELEALGPEQRHFVKEAFIDMYEASSLYLTLDDGHLIVAHAGIRGDYIGRTDKKVKTFVLYGDITGEKHEDGSPVRRDWAKHYAHEKAFVVYGHTPVKVAREINNTINIDTGCVFGGSLSAYRYPEGEVVSVLSRQIEVPEKFREFED